MTTAENAAQQLAHLLESEKALTCGQESRSTYSDLHSRRFADILDLCRSYLPSPSARVLDIGRSELTAYLHSFYRDLHTLGLDPTLDDGGHRELTGMHSVPHITFDLLESHRTSQWPACGSFDLIVFSEVIEHLCIAPEYVLALLGSLLTEYGILICTTPNAASLAKRLRLALGRNPYERLRLYAANPGHIREYTRSELCEIANSVGLTCRHHSYRTWPAGPVTNPVKVLLTRLLYTYPSFRPFQSIVFKRQQAPRP